MADEKEHRSLAAKLASLQARRQAVVRQSRAALTLRAKAEKLDEMLGLDDEVREVRDKLYSKARAIKRGVDYVTLDDWLPEARGFLARLPELS